MVGVTRIEPVTLLMSTNALPLFIIIYFIILLKNETILFGGNGKWGNSESTMLVSNPEYSSWGGRWTKEEREKNVKQSEAAENWARDMRKEQERIHRDGAGEWILS